MNVQSTRQCIDKPQQKYVPLSDRNSAQIYTGKEVKVPLLTLNSTNLKTPCLVQDFGHRICKSNYG